ncbi:phage holin [Eggerthellaceae bacterium zg-997]|nr:phage holin [Eggerthellaceae bacterium zg-997]
MDMNLSLRLRNKATLAALIGLGVTFVYQALAIFGVTPPVAESELTQLVAIVISVLAAVGVLVDPTTEGIGDSERAMGYDAPAPRG